MKTRSLGRSIVTRPRAETLGAAKPLQKRTSVRFSPQVKKLISFQVVEQGYGLRGKSAWVSKAAEDFIDDNTWGALGPQGHENGVVFAPWKRMIIDNEQMMRESGARPDTIMIDEQLWRRLWRASLDAAHYGAALDEPIFLEINVASVIRAAVLWRLGELN